MSVCSFLLTSLPSLDLSTCFITDLMFSLLFSQQTFPLVLSKASVGWGYGTVKTHKRDCAAVSNTATFIPSHRLAHSSFQRKYTVWHERCHAVKVGLQGGILLDCVRLPNTLPGYQTPCSDWCLHRRRNEWGPGSRKGPSAAPLYPLPLHFTRYDISCLSLGTISSQVLNPLEGDELVVSLGRTDDYSGSSQDPQ